MPEFCHLHCHTQFSLLDGASNIDKMLAKAKADGQPAVAITDHGNMFGAFKFYLACVKHEVKPIIGCEFYVVEDRFQKKFDKIRKDKRYHQLLMAKNEQGYRNLSTLCSLGFMEGYYSKYPRVDKGLIRQYKEGLVATSCCVSAEVPRTFLEKGEEAAEKVFLEWLDIFGEDYYVELQRHHLNGIDQEGANQFMIKMAQKHNVPMIATNDSHYVEQDDWLAHDILLCINTGDFRSTPVGDGKGYRFGFENHNFYFKTRDEMAALFPDHPQALENTIAIAEKIETPNLKRDILLPNFSLPEGFETEDDYLKHLSFEGALKRYGEINAEVEERLNYELKVVKDMGFAGYFLIVQDFIAAAKDLNVAVGPGRGSAAGSAIAYTTGITNIDPIKYNLLFERFLNPERVSMPDIDIDFDDEGRQKVIDYVVNKYGDKQVAQIITFGSMAAKSSIRDVGRVLEYPLGETDRLAKMIPDGVGVNLKRAFSENPDMKAIRKDEETEPGKVLKLAESLEGSLRQRGIHAAGIIIAPDDLTKYIPVCTAKESDLLVTQFDGRLIEDAGMLKMDFLGLKTLSIINGALELIDQNHGVQIDIETIPLDDEKTFELFQGGDTIGTFQFESDGMSSHLKELKPTNIEDLIAMNALYRPGPMDYIPSFIRRKHGKEEVEYPHEMLKDLLEPTYGIMVYQEQIMQTAQIIGGFSLGKADILRKAMGKKKLDVMQAMKSEFVEGAAKNDIEEKEAEKIFNIMEKFAQYGFNRSHAAAYSVVAFQTAYLKANYPAEFMASVLDNNMNDIKKVEFFMKESKHMNIPVLGPDVNESNYKFAVNKKGQIRFGLGAVKGVGEGAVEAIVEERQASGEFVSIFDMTKRVNLRAVNKKCLESLAQSGALDCFNQNHRAQYFAYNNGDQLNTLERAVKFGNDFKNFQTNNASSLFGDSLTQDIPEPKIPQIDPWPEIELLRKEKEMTGIYVSGHPLDEFKLEIENFTSCGIDAIEKHADKKIRLAGIVSQSIERMDKKGRKYGRFAVEDFEGKLEFALWREDYLKHRHLLATGQQVFMTGVYKKRDWGDDDRKEFHLENVELLSEIREKLTKSLTLHLPLEGISEETVSAIDSVCTSYPGKFDLKLMVTDRSAECTINFFSMKYKVDVNPEMMEELRTINQLHFKLN